MRRLRFRDDERACDSLPKPERVLRCAKASLGLVELPLQIEQDTKRQNPNRHAERLRVLPAHDHADREPRAVQRHGERREGDLQDNGPKRAVEKAARVREDVVGRLLVGNV